MRARITRPASSPTSSQSSSNAWRRTPTAIAGTTSKRSSSAARRKTPDRPRPVRAEIDDDEWFETEGRPDAARALFEEVALADDFAEFLTLPAYDYLLETVEREVARAEVSG